MTIVETFDARLAASGTHSNTFVVATALSVCLLASQAASIARPAKLPKGLYESVDASQGTAQISRESLTDEGAILSALFALHDHLVSEQVDLAADERALIYTNLWDLYE